MLGGGQAIGTYKLSHILVIDFRLTLIQLEEKGFEHC